MGKTKQEQGSECWVGGPQPRARTKALLLARPARSEKDEIIRSLRSRLSIAQQQQQTIAAHRGGGEGLAAGAPQPQQAPPASSAAALEAQNAQLEGANLQLRQRLQETLEELRAAHDQLAILQQLQVRSSCLWGL